MNADYKHEWYLKNREKILKDRRRYRELNTNKILAYDRERGIKRRSDPVYKKRMAELTKNWSIKNKDKINLKRRELRKLNRIPPKEKPKKTVEQLRIENNIRNRRYYYKHRTRLSKEQNHRMQKRIKNDIGYRLIIRMKNRLWFALKGIPKKEKTKNLIGCSVQELRTHLERQFKDGMSWSNYGRNGWTLDHIRPLSSFNLSSLQELKTACHYTNLQPLWELDNIRKGNKII